MKTRVRSLQTVFKPQLITLKLAVDEDVIRAAQNELELKAKLDSNYCFGYFPALKGKKDIVTDLPACQVLAAQLPHIKYDKRTLDFNFARLSLAQQKGSAPYHLDTDAATALTGDTNTLASRLVWRLLINMHPHVGRTLGYLDVDPQTVELGNDGSYVHCINKQVETETAQTIVIPPRDGTQVLAVLFCASRVLHTGKDDENGHFVVGYGCEEMA